RARSAAPGRNGSECGDSATPALKAAPALKFDSYITSMERQLHRIFHFPEEPACDEEFRVQQAAADSAAAEVIAHQPEAVPVLAQGGAGLQATDAHRHAVACLPVKRRLRASVVSHIRQG